MPAAVTLNLQNGSRAPLAELPVCSVADFRTTVLDAIDGGCRIMSFFGLPAARDGVQLVALLANDGKGVASAVSTVIIGGEYPALTPDCPQLNGFEREVAEQWGVVPVDHPWFKPLRFHRPYRPGRDAWRRPAVEPLLPGVAGFFQVAGEEIHEVAVGPVQAGLTDAGHYRFQCHGEHVFHLEIALGYQYRGIERALIGGPDLRTRHYMETVAGDTTIGHATAYCMNMESLAGVTVSPRADTIRAIALELERLANHTGDLGALASDIGFLPTASYCGRLRGDILNLTALICGNRFGRGLVIPGGVGHDIEEAQALELTRRLLATFEAIRDATAALWKTSAVLARLEGIGTLTAEQCEELGMVGLPARAAGLDGDVRSDFPAGAYKTTFLPAAVYKGGDVYARAQLRWLEIQLSVNFIRDLLDELPDGPLTVPLGVLAPETLALALTEGWRGEICHVAMTDRQGRFARYKITDPSFHNWMGVAMALRGQEISDFPVCNTSFNLSYCGHDL